jgi:hypothetical protein
MGPPSGTVETFRFQAKKGVIISAEAGIHLSQERAIGKAVASLLHLIWFFVSCGGDNFSNGATRGAKFDWNHTWVADNFTT